ncbi:MAG: GNAT family N-acetyltransferase [Prosthecochloris sp.]|nr:GNAT family N-acetyltransferase [Prosthecochloris sp.]
MSSANRKKTPPSCPIIRPATRNDIDDCISLLHHLFSQEAEFMPDRERQYRGLGMIVDRPEAGIIFIARHPSSRAVCGMVVLLNTVSTALGQRVLLLEDMVVDPASRGQGIGSQLLEAVSCYAEKHKFGRITLLTDSDNTFAHGFYEKNGFTRSGMTVFRKKIPSH